MKKSKNTPKAVSSLMRKLKRSGGILGFPGRTEGVNPKERSWANAVAKERVANLHRKGEKESKA